MSVQKTGDGNLETAALVSFVAHGPHASFVKKNETLDPWKRGNTNDSKIADSDLKASKTPMNLK